MAFFYIKFLISFCYCSISFILYTMLIIMLLRNWKEFRSAFFNLVIADYFFNLFTWLNSMISPRLPNGTCKDCILSEFFSALGKDNPYTGGFLYISYFFVLGNGYLQNGMITLMSLNRVTTIVLYFKTNKVWNFLLPIYSTVVVLSMIIGTRSILYSTPYYIYNDALDMYKLYADLKDIPAYSNLIYFIIVSASLSAFFNLVSAIRLKTMKSETSSFERKLYLITIFSSVIQCFAAGNTYILQADPNRVTLFGQTAQLIAPFVSDLLTISQPYVLMIFSSKVRNGFLNMYFAKKVAASELSFTRTYGLQPES
ncbi:unnamed protein product [Caenorhabditis brenneri]